MDPEIGILYRDISQFKDTEIPKAIELIQAVAREINGELAAKGHSGGHMGKLDFRRTIRKGLETGGSFYRLRYRRCRIGLFCLCDRLKRQLARLIFQDHGVRVCHNALFLGLTVFHNRAGIFIHGFNCHSDHIHQNTTFR